jgi:hypothetical protein
MQAGETEYAERPHLLWAHLANINYTGIKKGRLLYAVVHCSCFSMYLCACNAAEAEIPIVIIIYGCASTAHYTPHSGPTLLIFFIQSDTSPFSVRLTAKLKVRDFLWICSLHYLQMIENCIGLAPLKLNVLDCRYNFPLMCCLVLSVVYVSDMLHNLVCFRLLCYL